MKSTNKMYVVTLAIALSIGVVFADQGRSRESGTSSDGGGHGIRTVRGTELLDDYEPSPEKTCPSAKEINLFSNASTAAAAQGVLNTIKDLSSKYPDFSKRLNRFFTSGMRWKFCPTALPFLNDHDYKGMTAGALLQGAIQFSNRLVLIDQQIFENSDDRYRSGLITHEILLGYLGLAVLRDNLRMATRAIRAQGGPDFEQLEESLNDIHPSILKGETIIQAKYSLDGKEPGSRPAIGITWQVLDCSTSRNIGETFTTVVISPQSASSSVCFGSIRLYNNESAVTGKAQYAVYVNGVQAAAGRVKVKSTWPAFAEFPIHFSYLVP